MNEWIYELLGNKEPPDYLKPKYAESLYNAMSPQYQGMYEAGNIDVNKRPRVPNKEGGYNTVVTATFDLPGGKTILLPRFVNGKVLEPKDAFNHYKKTGEHLGIFHSRDAADLYDELMHKQMGWIGSENKW